MRGDPSSARLAACAGVIRPFGGRHALFVAAAARAPDPPAPDLVPHPTRRPDMSERIPIAALASSELGRDTGRALCDVAVSLSAQRRCSATRFLGVRDPQGVPRSVSCVCVMYILQHSVPHCSGAQGGSFGPDGSEADGCQTGARARVGLLPHARAGCQCHHEQIRRGHRPREERRWIDLWSRVSYSEPP